MRSVLHVLFYVLRFMNELYMFYISISQHNVRFKHVSTLNFAKIK